MSRVRFVYPGYRPALPSVRSASPGYTPATTTAGETVYGCIGFRA